MSMGSDMWQEQTMWQENVPFVHIFWLIVSLLFFFNFGLLGFFFNFGMPDTLHTIWAWDLVWTYNLPTKSRIAVQEVGQLGSAGCSKIWRIQTIPHRSQILVSSRSLELAIAWFSCSCPGCWGSQKWEVLDDEICVHSKYNRWLAFQPTGSSWKLETPC